ncbi:hypothetical protein H9W84_03195 [Moraxella sp. PS-22]|uniref:Uncharacterized protein n=1 Tax=Moraxella tetraodonis TaxID=2767221 RepID=A0A9X1UQH7_9GAMM|nr:hypothetical protein [Moraxella tetraodonis]MCG8147132.1 hypothetical protein [Moraxella tetraodonis]
MPENRFTAIYNELKQYTQLNSKISMYTNTRQSYISTRNILSYFDWFKSSNESQLIWALEYLDKMKIPVYPRLFLPNSNQEIYDAIVVSITFMGFENAMTFSRINVENFIKKMRQAWYQKRYRDNKDGESALQYLLSKSYLKKLDKLSEIYGVPPLEVLQSLIAQEYDKR